jgi:hypothetical protein
MNNEVMSNETDHLNEKTGMRESRDQCMSIGPRKRYDVICVLRDTKCSSLVFAWYLVFEFSHVP